MDIVELLKQQAQEIAKEGHDGWGNTMIWAAEEIEKLRAAQQSAQRTCAQCGADDWRDAVIPDTVEVCNRCGASR